MSLNTRKDLGPISAYALAVAGGYQGTEAEFEQYLADAGTKAAQAVTHATAAESNALKSEGYAVGKQNGTDVSSGDAYYNDNAKYFSDQAAQSAQAAVNAKDTILGMSATANALSAGTSPTASYANGVLTLGIPAGVTYTPAINEDGVLSFTNNGGASNPAPFDIVGSVRDLFVENISGTAPVITGDANHRYICGEVLTISITPPNLGIVDVIFTSGSTATVLTLPATVKMPDWFDATSLETDTIYEINILDGVYGAVMTWPTV